MFKMIHLEPFLDLFFLRASLRVRLMRFFGRIKFFKQFGYDESYSKSLGHIKFKLINSDKSVVKILEELQAQGYSGDINLSSEVLCEVIKAVDSLRFHSRNKKEANVSFTLLNLINPSDESVYICQNPHKAVPVLTEVANIELKPLADAYLGANSVLLNTALLLSFPSQKKNYNVDYGFHYDIDDYRFLKVFFYLTDVNLDSGPHEIILESHHSNAFLRFFNRRLNGVPQRFKDKVHTILGPAGSGFFEDTYCYHRGSDPQRPRLMLQLEFGLNKI